MFQAPALHFLDLRLPSRYPLPSLSHLLINPSFNPSPFTPVLSPILVCLPSQLLIRLRRLTMPRQQFHADLEELQDTGRQDLSSLSNLRKADDGEMEFTLRLSNEIDVKVVGLVQSMSSLHSQVTKLGAFQEFPVFKVWPIFLCVNIFAHVTKFLLRFRGHCY